MIEGPEGEAFDFSQADTTLRCVLHPGNMVSPVLENDNTGILVAVPSAPSPELHIPDSPHVTIVSSIHSPLEPRLSSFNKKLCFGPLSCACVSRHLSLAKRILAAIHSQMFCEYLFLALVLWAGEGSLGLDLTLLKRIPPAAEPCLWNLALSLLLVQL